MTHSIKHFIEVFNQSYSKFYNDDEATFANFRKGPCIYFHTKTICIFRKYRSDSSFNYEKLITDERFVESVYATLTAWGMNRLGGGPVLTDFEQFSSSLRNKELIEYLEKLRDDSILSSSTKILDISKKIFMLFEDKAINITKNKRQLVTISKTLHHLHPDLFPLIDKQYTIKLLKKIDDQKYRCGLYKDGFEAFQSAFLFFNEVAKQNNSDEWQKYNGIMDTSIPKIIDNAIVGFSKI